MTEALNSRPPMFTLSVIGDTTACREDWIKALGTILDMMKGTIAHYKLDAVNGPKADTIDGPVIDSNVEVVGSYSMILGSARRTQ